MKQQKGFTLVEMAIVLVIIGLLLGGVLKGQELIESSRIKNAANDINGVVAAHNGYIDRFRAIPGNDAGATDARGEAWTAATAGSGSGTIATEAEAVQYWVHLRSAGFIAGDPAVSVAPAVYPKHAFGGLMYVTPVEITGALPTGAADGATAPASLPAGALKVCLAGVPGKAARAIDVAMDDGASGRGVVRAAADGAPQYAAALTALGDYSDDVLYTLCRAM